MTTKMIAVAAGALAALSMASFAVAQTTPPKPTYAKPAAPAAGAKPAAAQPGFAHGTPVSGLCIINPQAVVLSTNAAQAMFNKINAEFTTEGAAIRTAMEPYKANPALAPADLQKRGDDFNKKVSARFQNLKPEEAAILERLNVESGPIIAEVYQAKKCSILLDSQVVVSLPANTAQGPIMYPLVNQASDIGKAVVDKLNAKVQ